MITMLVSSNQISREKKYKSFVPKNARNNNTNETSSQFESTPGFVMTIMIMADDDNILAAVFEEEQETGGISSW